MEKKDMLVSIVVITFYLLFWNMFLESDLKDYLQYKKDMGKYEVENVKVEETRSRYRSHSKYGDFYYYDYSGTRRKGTVCLNYNEQKGDYIAVAFDEYKMYIRPIVTVSGGGIFDYFILVCVGVVIIKSFIKQYNGEQL